MDDFFEIVEIWGRPEMSADLKIPKDMPRQWWRDNSIPAWYWRRMLDKAPERNIDISNDLLIDMAERRHCCTY